MIVTSYYDDTRLQAMLNALEPRRRMQAFKGAFRRAANEVRKVALSRLRQSGLKADKEIRSQIQRIIYKNKLGFRVTIGHKRKAGGKKPILMWGEGGTEERWTKSKTRFWRRKLTSHYTGAMRAYGFMEATKAEVTDSVTGLLRESIIKSIERVVKKYGATIS